MKSAPARTARRAAGETLTRNYRGQLYEDVRHIGIDKLTQACVMAAGDVTSGIKNDPALFVETDQAAVAEGDRPVVEQNPAAELKALQ